MAKHGIASFLPEILAGGALGATGLGALGIGPLAGLAGGAGAAGDVAAAGGGAAGDVASAVAPAVAAGAGDITAGTAPFLVPGTESALTAGGALAPQTAFDFATGTALPTAGIDAASGAVPVAAATGSLADATPFLIPGTDTALSGVPALTTSLGGVLPTVGPQAAIDPGLPASTTDLSALPAGYTEADYPPEFSGGDTGGGLFGQGGIFGSGGFFDKNSGLIKPALALGGLGLSALMNRGPIPGSQPVTAGAQTATTNAATLQGQANQNLNALNTGALPAGAQSAIDQAANSAKAAIRSNYASMGITGPYSGEAEALASVDQQKAVQQNAQAQALVNTGVQEARLAEGQQGIAAGQYLPLMEAAILRDEQLQAALGRFAGAFA